MVAAEGASGPWTRARWWNDRAVCLRLGAIWQAVVALACDITAWTQMLALTEHPARRWEPKRLRLRLFSPSAQRAHHARTTVLHLPSRAPWTDLVITGVTRLRALAVPG
jgi:hypothetical protein